MTTLLQRWGIPLLGVVPDEPYLGRPSLMDLEKIFKTEVKSRAVYRQPTVVIPIPTKVYSTYSVFTAVYRGISVLPDIRYYLIFGIPVLPDNRYYLIFGIPRYFNITPSPSPSP